MAIDVAKLRVGSIIRWLDVPHDENDYKILQIRKDGRFDLLHLNTQYQYPNYPVGEYADRIHCILNQKKRKFI